MSAVEQRLVRVADVREAATDVKSYDLVAADGRPLPAFAAGAHIDVHVPGGSRRQYSLCGDPRDSSRYTIAVKREATGRGGSAAMHAEVSRGTVLAITGPRNHFPLASESGPAVFIAGGIGITPIFAMVQTVNATGGEWHLHYCARSMANAAFYPQLQKLSADRVHSYFSKVPLLDVQKLLHSQAQGIHLYCCGPASLMTAVADAASHWTEGSVHFEWFAAPAVAHRSNRPFEIELRRSGLLLHVPIDRSILQVIRENGIDVESACEEGVCGTCETKVCAGRPEHRDFLLSSSERASGRSMMICVSRSLDNRLVLDL